MDLETAWKTKSIDAESLLEVLGYHNIQDQRALDFFNQLERAMIRRKDMADQHLTMSASSLFSRYILQGPRKVVFTLSSGETIEGVAHDVKRAGGKIVIVMDNKAYVLNSHHSIRVYLKVPEVENDDLDAVNDAFMIEPPTEPGFYKYSGGNQNMIFLLGRREKYQSHGKWTCFFSNGEVGPCEWGYIEQALSVWDLVKI